MCIGTSIYVASVLPRGIPCTHSLSSVGCPCDAQLSSPHLGRGRGIAPVSHSPTSCPVRSWGCREGCRDSTIYLLPKGNLPSWGSSVSWSRRRMLWDGIWGTSHNAQNFQETDGNPHAMYVHVFSNRKQDPVSQVSAMTSPAQGSRKELWPPLTVPRP